MVPAPATTGPGTPRATEGEPRRAAEYPELHSAPRQLPPGAAYAPQHAPAPAPSRLVDSPVNYSRPLSISPAPPPPPHHQQHSNSAPPALHTRRSFVGPAHHLASPSSSSSSTRAPTPGAPSPSTRTAAASGMSLASQYPTFVPAPAFSPEDRGPYPPSPARDVREPTQVKADYLDSAPSSAAPAPTLARPRSLAAFHEPASSSAAAAAAASRDLDMAGVGTRASLILPSSSTTAAASTSAPVLLSPPSRATGGAPAPARSPQLVAASPYASAPSASAALVSPSPVAGPAPPPAAPAAYSTAPAPGPPPPPPPPHLVPQPEVCVECMMRDRDMADVDVTGARVWERDSDAEWDEQVRWEADQVEQLNGGGGGPGSYDVHGGGNGSSESGGALGGPGVRRSVYERESSSAHTGVGAGPGGRRRLGKGQLLTSGNLKVWTTMNPPAAAHRWRTLQTFLATQAHYLELDRQARIREASAAAAAVSASSSPHGSSPIELLPTAVGAPPRNRASSLLSPESLAAEKAALEHEERVALRAIKSRSRATLADETNLHQHQHHLAGNQNFRHSSASLLPPPSLYNGASGNGGGGGGGGNASSGSSMRSYSAGDQPWLGPTLRRLSSPSAGAPVPGAAGASQLSASPPKSPATSMASSRFAFPKFARSSTDLRSLPPAGGGGGGGGATPRSVSPARTSGDGSARRPTSMWSRFRQSASAASVLSFAPSGSMMDMHLGLEQDQRAGLAAAGGPGYGSLGHYGAGVGGGFGGGGAAMYAAQHGAGAGAGAAGYGFGSPQQAVYDTYGAAAMSDPAVARHADRRERERVLAETAAAREAAAAAAAAEAEHGAGKKKKKGLKGFFNKLVGGGGGGGSGRARSRTLGSSSAPATPGVDRGAPFDASLGPGSRYGGAGAAADDELAPPPPLSALANEPRYHLRSGSSSSVDSLGPYTPPLPPQQQFRQSYHMSMPGGGHAADRQSILTLGSFTSTRSNGNGGGGGGGGSSNKAASGAGARASTVPSRNSWVGRPSLDSVRRPGSFAGGQALGGGPGDAETETEVLAGAVDDLDLDPEQQHDDEHELLQPPPQPRSQKSLPLLPSEATYRGGSPSPHGASPYDPYHAANTAPRAGPPASFDAPLASAGPYGNYGASRSAYTLGSSPAADSRASLAQEFGLVGGDREQDEQQQQHTVRKSRSRPKVFSLSFGSNGGKKSQHRQSSAEVPGLATPPPPPLPSAARGASLDSSSVMRYAEPYDGRPPAEALVGGMR
ncbi:hypothetical protein JCM3775_005897 [Rhodotorula graminis]